MAGTAAAYATNRLAAYHVIFHFGSALSASFWQAIIAFITGAVVLVLVSLVTKPKPEEELRGLVWGLTRKEEREEHADPRDKLWWRSPWLLGGVALGDPRGRAEHYLHLGAERCPKRTSHAVCRADAEEPMAPTGATEEDEVKAARRPPTASTSAG